MPAIRNNGSVSRRSARSTGPLRRYSEPCIPPIGYVLAELRELAGISHGLRASVAGGSSTGRPVSRSRREGGQMPAHFGSWEGTRPFGGRLAAWQADQVEAVRALLAKAGRVPRMAWVTPPDAI